jgi:pimeloyl-ACP methyl ester carboxylesterase
MPRVILGAPSHNRKPPIEAPVGMTFLGFENPPGVTTDQRVEAFKKSPDAPWCNAIHLKAYEKGGHFAPFEHPEAIITDIRETFRRLN